jgi:hypothetical protein
VCLLALRYIGVVQRLPGSDESNSEDILKRVDDADSPCGQCSRKRKQSLVLFCAK